jgi:hypothetical protein
VWTLIPGVPIGCRSPRKRGPYSMPIHRPGHTRLGPRDHSGLDAGACTTEADIARLDRLEHVVFGSNRSGLGLDGCSAAAGDEKRHDRSGKSVSGGTSDCRERVSLDKIRNKRYVLTLAESLPAPAGPGKGSCGCLKTSLTTTRRISRERGHLLLIFFGRNPLKSPESEK